MGVLFDYFAAPSDEAAASTIEMTGGPGGSAPPATAQRALFRRRRVEQPEPASERFDTVSTKGIDPVVQMGTLEELLTGRDYDDVMNDPRCGRDLAVRDGGERVVLTLTDSLQTALADAGDEELAAVAEPWAQTEEFFGSVSGDDVLPFLRDMAALARRARGQDHRMYCWVCV